MDATTETGAGAHSPSPAGPPRPARRGGRRRPAEADGTLPLEAQTIKAYRLDEARRTVGYLRRIVNQRRIPDEARVAIDGERITIEWADE